MKWTGRVASIKNESQSDNTEVISLVETVILYVASVWQKGNKVLRVACLQLSCASSS